MVLVLEYAVRKLDTCQFHWGSKNEILIDGDFLVRGLQERRVAMLIDFA